MITKVKKGFILIELAVSASVLGIILIPFVGLISVAYGNNKYAQKVTESTSVTESTIEFYKGKIYGNSIEKFIRDTFRTTIDPDTDNIVFYSLYKKDNGMINSLKNYCLKSTEDNLDDSFESIQKKFNLDTYDYDYIIKSSFSIKDERSIIKINVTVWDSILRDRGKVNIVCFKGSI
jgi:type II secretory pathway pseudopilin PulG